MLYSIWYHHTETSEGSKITKYKNTRICELSWSITKIRLTTKVSSTAKVKTPRFTNFCFLNIYEKSASSSF